MTKKQWDKRLNKKLSALPYKERRRVLDYYDELYWDKRDAGFSEEAILEEFGAPEEAAARALEESGAPKTKKGAAGSNLRRPFCTDVIPRALQIQRNKSWYHNHRGLCKPKILCKNGSHQAKARRKYSPI